MEALLRLMLPGMDVCLSATLHAVAHAAQASLTVHAGHHGSV